MPSEIDICNLALSHLGDDATVASISPPEGSPQAEHCARFYPIARDALLEMHPWGFASKRKTLALLDKTPPSAWAYAYATPPDALNLLAIYAPDASDDYEAPMPQSSLWSSPVFDPATVATPQPFVNETDDTGADMIYTNIEGAVLRYSARVTDCTQFSPLFVTSLTWLLASMVAGPLLKGQAGMQAAAMCDGKFREWFGRATASDANQRRAVPQATAPWMAAR